MIEEILKAAAIPSQAARYPEPPEVYAVYFDSVNTDGSDLTPSDLTTHNCTVELYAPSISKGNSAMQRLKLQLDTRGIRYTTQGWYWLNAVQRYQEIIEFSNIERV